MTSAVSGTQASDSRAGRLLAGRYRLDRPIATGGMAQVWEATDEVLARQVAVKVLHAHLAADESFVARFRREAIAAARLGHPSIVAIYDTCSDEGTEAIVMELVRGRTLKEELEERETRAVEPTEAVDIVSQVADALECAHRAGIIHRDVKPANILRCEDGRVMVADFGIAKAAEGGDLTEPGALIGTAKYLAPEQVDGGDVDPRADVYSLGVVLYELLCGRPPFVADTEAATALARLQRDPLRPRQVRAGISKPLEDVVLKAMARDPDQRYGSAGEMRAALLATMRHDLPSPPGPDPTISVPPPPDEAQEPSPVPVRPPPRYAHAEPRGRRSVSVVPLLVVLVAAAVTAALALGVFEDENGGTRDTTTEAPLVVSIQEVTAFDPQGTGGENDEDARLAWDGDPTTAWSTEGYDSRALGGLKDGVGLVVELTTEVDVQNVIVTSPTQGWAAEIYVSAAPGSDLDSWGQPVTEQSGIEGEATFELGGAHAGAVLIWITDLGDGPPRVSTEIAEVAVTAG